MRKLILIFCLSFAFSVSGQESYVMSLEDGFFSITYGISINMMGNPENDINIQLPETNGIYTINALGDRKPLGIEKLEDFNKNKEVLISKYSEIIRNYGWADSSITYEVYDDKVFGDSYVKFYLNRRFSSTIPTGKISIKDGIYLLEIWKESEFIQSFYLLVENNKLRQFPIDYKLE
jgi:hypothetical protein